MAISIKVYDEKVDYTILKSLSPLRFNQSTTEGIQAIPVNISGSSSLGNKVLSDITFGSGFEGQLTSIKDIYGNEYSFNNYRNYQCLITVQQSKNIIEENVLGQDGTTKDYISLSDYNITISMILNTFDSTNGTGGNGIYPLSQMQNVINIFRFAGAIPITSWYLNQVYNIQQIVIYSIEAPQEFGSISQQFLTLNCKSDFQRNIANI